ncbi:MAG: hypothetical protein ABI782_09430 [Anaerolineaceae bacterium]
MSDRSAEYDALCNDLEAHWEDQGGTHFRAAVRRLEARAQGGSLAAGEYLAEILALDGPLHDAAAAYKWYYIALSEQGYSVGFEDQNASPPHYCGPVGDFRNEAMVSDLVVELGFARAAELDREAAELRAAHTWSEA